MNIILLNKKSLILICLLMAGVSVYSQEHPFAEKGYSLSAYFGSGFIANIDNTKKFNENIYYSPALRLLWKPDHLLNIGLESAYLTISKQDSTTVSTDFGSTAFRARLNAIPILLVFNMKFSKIEFYYGIGISYVTSRLEAFNERVVVSHWYYCYDVAIAYSHPLSKNLAIGIEAKTYFFPKLQKVSGGLLINFSYRFLKW